MGAVLATLVTEDAYLAGPRRLCDTCQAAHDKWVEHQGTLHLPFQIIHIGRADDVMPTGVRTEAIRRAQLQNIRDICRIHHTEATR